MDVLQIFDAILGAPIPRAMASGSLALLIVQFVLKAKVKDPDLYPILAFVIALVLNFVAEWQVLDRNWIRALLYGLIGGVTAAGTWEQGKKLPAVGSIFAGLFKKATP